MKTMRFLPLLLLTFPAMLAGQTIDDNTYRLDAIYTPETRTLECRGEVDFRNRSAEAMDTLYFRLENGGREKNPYQADFLDDSGFQNGFEPSWTEVKTVRLKTGETLAVEYIPLTNHIRMQKYSLDRSLFAVKLLKPLAAGETLTLAIQFSVHVPEVTSLGGFGRGERGFARNSLLMRFGWYPVEAPRNAEGKWDLGVYTFPFHRMERLTLLLPLGWQAVLPGDRVSAETNGKNVLWTAVSSASVQATAVAASPDYDRLTGKTPGGVEVSVWFYRDSSYTLAGGIFLNALSAVEDYSTRYGPLPTSRVNIVNTPFMQAFGMAADGTVLLGDNLFSTANILLPHFADRILDEVVSHEIAHLWSGIGAAVDFSRGNFQSEGLTEFLAVTRHHERFTNGADLLAPEAWSPLFILWMLVTEQSPLGTYTISENFQASWLQNLRNGFDRALYSEYADVALNGKSANDYKKGYLFFSALETALGRDVFRTALREYFVSFRGKKATPADFQLVCEKVSGLSLSGIFATYVYGESVCDYYVKGVSVNGDTSTVSVGKTGAGDLPLEIETVLSGGKRERFTLFSVPAGGTNLTLPYVVNGVLLDPDMRIPDAERMNNKTVDHLDLYVFPALPMLAGHRPTENYRLGLYPYLSLSSDVSNGMQVAAGLFVKFGAPRYWDLQIGGGPNWSMQVSSNSTPNALGQPTVSNVDFLSAGYRFEGAFSLLLPKSQKLSLQAKSDGAGHVDAGLAYTLPIYLPMDIGSYASYEYPSFTFTAGLQRKDILSVSPLHVLSSTLAWDGMVKHAMLANVGLEGAANIPGFNDVQYIKASGAWSSFVRLAPRLILSPALQAGYLDPLGASLSPRVTLFHPAQFQRGANVSNTEDWGNSFANVSLDLGFPIAYGGKVNLLDCVILRGVSAGLFAETGGTWNTMPGGSNFWTQALRVNGGAEITFLFSTLIDELLPLTLHAGRNLWHFGKGKMTDEWSVSLTVQTTPSGLVSALYGY